MNLREIVGNIKRPYLTPLIIFTILISLFDAIMFLTVSYMISYLYI